MLSAAVLTQDYFLLPGRLRITVPGLRRNETFAKFLTLRLQSSPGVKLVSANALTGRALIYFEPKYTGLESIRRETLEIGQAFINKRSPAQPAQPAKPAVSEIQPGEAGDLGAPTALYAMATGGVLTGLIAKRVVVGRSPLAVSPHLFNLAAVTTLISGYPVLKNGISTLTRDKRLSSDLVLFAATLGLLAMRESITGLSVLWLVHLSHLFQHAVQMRSRKAVRKLLRDKQPAFRRMTDQGVETAEAATIQPGDVLIIHSGEIAPVDGTVTAGKAVISRHNICGDSAPVLAGVNDSIPAGALVLSGALKLRADTSVHNTSIAPLEHQAEELAQQRGLSRIPSDDHVSMLTWLSIGVAGVIFLLTRDSMRSLAVLLAGCPAAVALARNTAWGSSVAAGAKRGMLIKDARRFEAAGQADMVVFDKTGTLTSAAPEIEEIITLHQKYNQEQLLAFAASAARGSCHPLARRLVGEAKTRNIALRPSQKHYVSQDGIRANVDGHIVDVGNELFLRQAAIPVSRARSRAAELAGRGAATLLVAIDGRIIGMLAVGERLRPGCHRAINTLRSLGIQDVGLLSGDSEARVAAAASKLELNHCWSSVLPAEKAAVVRRLRNHGKTVIMVGDGYNDAPALAASHLGVVMGQTGANSAIAAADVALLSDDPCMVPELIHLSRKTQRVIKQNLVLSLGINATGIALAAATLISPITAGLLLNFSTVAVIANSARLLARPRQKPLTDFNLQRHSLTGIPLTAAAPDAMVFLPQSAGAGDERAATSSNETLWSCSLPDLFRRLRVSDKTGISEEAARERLLRYGANRLEEGPRPSFLKLFAAQFKDLMVQVLIGAAGISFVLGKTGNALLTMAIIVGNAILGVVQEMRSERSIDALRRLAAPQGRVLRDGGIKRVNAESLVPGDVIVLEAGDRVPADARLIKTYNFEVEESSLTGETIPVKKSAEFAADAALAAADRKNVVYMGTSVTRGRATAVIIATGMATEMGKIASLIQHNKEDHTPLQQRLEELGKYLVYGCLAVSGLVFLTGLLRGESFFAMLQTAATLAVAAIPEGMTGIVVIALAMGVQRMSKRNIIIRKLSSIETLGCATVICSDKTGTLTKNQMTVREIFTMSTPWQVTGEGYNPSGKFMPCCRQDAANAEPELEKTLLAGALCNNAHLLQQKVQQSDKVVNLEQHRASGWYIDGDPTEGALIVAVAKRGMNEQMLENSYRRIREIPFESERRMMSVICSNEAEGLTLYAKGASDSILAACSHYLVGKTIVPLSQNDRQQINQAIEEMTSKALRVLACAYRPIAQEELGMDADQLESKLIFCGLVGMIDPPRSEVPDAIAKCRLAGVKVVMITGDHPNTACAIAREIGIMQPGEQVLLGYDIDNMTDSQLITAATDTTVYARTSPQHKLRIVKALRANGHVAAMTGDGVNDAPAVKAADIGIAMGIAGTDVTKEAASMTLADDNFATIVRAIEEGRSIYANIRKAIRYLLATNIGEVALMLLAALLGMPLPLLPIQLLWINLVGDGLPAIALVNDPPAEGIMSQPPRTADESVFSGDLGRKVMLRGLIIGGASLLLYYWRLIRTGSIVAARTLVLAHLAVTQFMHIFDCRLEKETGRVKCLSNTWLIAAVASSMALVAASIHLPALQPVFGTTSLGLGDWLLTLALAGISSLADIALNNLAAKMKRPAQQQPAFNSAA